MVWGLFPADPLSGEEKYYIFRKGSYKVGRKGCDVNISKDKGVSRIHAEIVVEEMTVVHLPQKTSDLSSRVRIRDSSKYGTFINKNSHNMEKVHESPSKETILNDGDLISFGTGNAIYRFCYVPLVFFLYCSESFQERELLQETVSSIGARVTYHLDKDCTHVLVDQLMPIKEDIVDAVVAKKPIILKSWVELIAEKNISPEIPVWNSYVPTLTFEGISVEVVDSRARTDCLKGYTCILGATHMYRFGDRLKLLLEGCGATVTFIEEFSSNSQVLDYGENTMLCVIPRGSAETFDQMRKLSSLSRVNEVDLVCAVLSGHLDSSKLISPSVVISSSCSTDETIVADSDVEAEGETATSSHAVATLYKEEAPPKLVHKEEISIINHPPSTSLDSHVIGSVGKDGGIATKIEKVDDSDVGNCDIIYSQDLIVRGLNPTKVTSTENSRVLNFKRFRKGNIQSGNDFGNLIPFSKYPYKDSGYENQDTVESMKEEKQRKQMEAIAEDLFNNEKGRRRGVAGSLHGLLTRGR